MPFVATRTTPVYAPAWPNADLRVLGTPLPKQVWCSGHSAMAGTGTTAAAKFSLAKQIQRVLGIPAADFIDSSAAFSGLLHTLGTTTYTQQNAAAGDTRTAGPYVPQFGSAVHYWGTNDINLATDVEWEAALRSSMRFLLACSLSSRFYAYNNGALTWAGGAANAVAEVKGAGTRSYSASQGAALAFTTPTDWEGGHAVLYFQGKTAPANTNGAIVLTVDAGTADIFQVGGLATTSGGAMPAAWRFYVGPGAHTIQASVIWTTGTVKIAGIGLESPTPPPVVVLGCTNETHTEPDKGRLQRVNKAWEDVVAEFPNSVVMIDLDTLLNANPKYTNDNVHLNDRGAALVAQEVARALQYASSFGGPNSMVAV